jgi:hypothetical protein
MSKEAMKLALKDLKWVDDWLCEKPMPECVARLQKAIKALEEALAKQEQGEPVAWGNLANWCLDSDRVLITDKNAAEKYHRDIYDLTALYTTPQQRTWVELTDEEVFETFGNFSTMTGKSWLDLYRITEAKRKEKNT